MFHSRDMLESLDITEAEIAGIGELAMHDLAMARGFAARAQAAEDPEVANSLARSYQRMARSYRQTLLLKVRLKRELTREANDKPPPPRDMAKVRRRMDDLRGPMMRIMWADYEPEEAADALETEGGVTAQDLSRLEHWMKLRAAQDPDFGEAPLDDDILSLTHDLGIPVEAGLNWRDLPDPPNVTPAQAPPPDADTS